MNTNHLELFVHLAETLNFSETSKNMHISQPAVSQAIKALEDELGCPLFIRNKRKVELTETGKSFYKDTKYILVNLYLAIEKAKEKDIFFKNTLTIGYTGTNFELEVIPQIINEFYKLNPEIQLYLETLNHNIAKNNLVNERSDLFFTTFDDIENASDLKYVELFKGSFVCILPKNHPLNKFKVVNFENLNNQTIILFNSNQCPPKQAEIQDVIKRNTENVKYFYTDSVLLSHTMVKGELGLTIAPSFVTVTNHNDFKVVPLNYSESLSYGIAYKETIKTPLVKSFIKCCKKIIKEEFKEEFNKD